MDMEAAHEALHSLYFDSAGMILTLITLGKFFEARAKGRTTSAITALMDLAPKTATVVRDGSEQVIPSEDVQVGDRVVVRAGESVPVDGVVVEGSALCGRERHHRRVGARGEDRGGPRDRSHGEQQRLVCHGGARRRR